MKTRRWQTVGDLYSECLGITKYRSVRVDDETPPVQTFHLTCPGFRRANNNCCSAHVGKTCWGLALTLGHLQCIIIPANLHASWPMTQIWQKCPLGRQSSGNFLNFVSTFHLEPNDGFIRFGFKILNHVQMIILRARDDEVMTF